VHCGDAATVLATLPRESVDAIVTSPPYYGQRDYGVEGEIGREATPQEYVERLREVFRECLRVLAPTGTLWLNLGDKYERGELLGMPWRVAFGLKDDGWLLRSDIIWHKPNAMPLSVKNRPTVDHEYLFLFVRQAQYFYDQDAIREPHRTFGADSRMRGGRGHFFQRGGTPEEGKFGGSSNLHDGRWDQAFHPKGRNRRTVWEIPLSKSRDAHFAVFPQELVRRCILAGAPAGGTVLDPFAGSGTTLVVAQELGRRAIGIDANPRYVELTESRLGVVTRV
jgi:DNA modification methylase